MQSAASLTTNAAAAGGDKSIALGDGATSNPFSTDGVAIGTSALNQSPRGVAVGADSYSRDGGVSVGQNSIAYNANDTALGNNADANGGSSTAVGDNATVASNKYHGVAVGKDTSVTGEFAGAFGSTSSATANGAYAVGQGVTAATADTVSVKALETQTDSTPTAGGIIMSDAGGTDRRINIDASGGLQIDSTPVGGGGAAGLVSGTGTDSLKNADSLVTLPTTSSGNGSIALGNNSDSLCINSIAIGGSSEANANRTISIGSGAGDNQPATAVDAISIGTTARAYGIKSIQIGYGESNCSGAAGDRAISIGAGDGYGVEADGDRSIAIGSGGSTLGSQTSATGNCSIALGYDAASGSAAVTIGACTNMGDSGVAIGFRAATGATTLTTATVAVGGFSNTGNNDFGTALGSCAKITADCSLAVGHAAQACANGAVNIAANPRFSNLGAFATCSVAIGSSACVAAGGIDAIAIGKSALAKGQEDVIVGPEACSNASNKGGTALGSTTVVDDGGVAIGRNAQAQAIHSISIGGQCNLFSTACTRATAIGAIAIGTGAAATGAASVALGQNTTISRSNTTGSCQFEACVAGKGIVVTSPDGLTTLGIGIDNTGAIVTYTP